MNKIKITFVVVSTKDNAQDLNNLVKSIASFDKFREYDVCVSLIGCDESYLENNYRFSKVKLEKEGTSEVLARLNLLREIEYDVYINLNTWTLLTKLTDYEPAIAKILTPKTGVVSTDWVKDEESLFKKSIKDEFVKQILVTTGGGMVYSNKTCNIFRDMDIEGSYFDDFWSVMTYINGLLNYRYIGSLSIKNNNKHRIRVDGDLLFLEQYIDYRKGKNGWYSPTDLDVKQYCKNKHKTNNKS